MGERNGWVCCTCIISFWGCSGNMFFFFFVLRQCGPGAKGGLVGWQYKTWPRLNDEQNEGVLASMHFTKKRNDTVLRLTWNSDLRLFGQEQCLLWYFTIDSKQCAHPAPVNGAVYFHVVGANRINSHRQSSIDGVCSGTKDGVLLAGPHFISINVGRCQLQGGGDAYTGWQSVSTMFVHELCPPF